MVVQRFDVCLVCLDPTQGREIKKTRPCLIISPDEMNPFLDTVIVAPMTSNGREYPSRVSCVFKGTRGQIVLDQIRTIDKSRIIKKLGTLDEASQKNTCDILVQMFSF